MVVERIGPVWSVRGVAVASAVRAQPWGQEETRAGALERARAALKAVLEAQLGVGLEGGVVNVDGALFTLAWCVIADREGRLGWGGGAMMPVPPSVAAAVRSGAELGPAMDQLSGLRESKRQMGAIGLLTNGLSSREEAYRQLVAMAFAPWLRPDWYT